ncbi:MAG: glycosyltransferase family 39 protein [Gammaproteobacteria bacterium]
MHWPRIDVSSRGAIALACCLILSPLWVTCLFDRGLWTPDEPREAAIGRSMSSQAERSIPLFAGQPFLEKPPLAYWAAGASSSLFPDHDAALRGPNLLYMTVATSSIVLLGFAAGGRATAWIAGLASGSSLLALQVASWLATDAAMMSGVTLALLGFYRGLESATSRPKALWYALMHAGLTIAFMAKGPAAWLVPVLAATGLLVFERNWRELLRWEIWIGLAIPGVVVTSWLVAVARSEDGGHALSVLLWQNVAGRVVTLPNADAAAYSNGHRNWPGKYFVELPIYLLPWTLLFVAAAKRAWTRLRAPDARAWRFATCGLVLPIVALSLAGTARGIYAAPLVPAASLLLGLWARDALAQPEPLDRRMIVATLWLVAGISVILAISTGFIVSSDPVARPWWPAAVAGFAVTGIAVAVARRNARAHLWPKTLAASFGAFLFALVATALTIFPAMDRWQDLRSLAKAVERDTRSRPLAIFAADETIVAAMGDADAAARPTYQKADSIAASRALLADSDRTVFLVRLGGVGDGPVLQRLRSLGMKMKTPAPPPSIRELAATLNLSVEKLYELPQGRRYALLSLQNKGDEFAEIANGTPKASVMAAPLTATAAPARASR